MPVADSTRPLPLRGIRILDELNDIGELTTRLLADLGADVVKVEPPGGTASRGSAPIRKGVSLGFAGRNSGKRSIVLDVTEHGDQERHRRLLGAADVLVTSDPAAVALIDDFPALVIAVITPYGLTGPYAKRAVTDAVLAATSGQTFKAGDAARRPLPPPGRFTEDVASSTAAWAVLCGVRQRLKTGRGDVLDISLNECAAQMSDWSMPNALARVRAGLPGGQVRMGSGPVYPVFPCRDGFLRLVVLSPRQWHAMRAWMGEPEYLQDPTYDSFVSRYEIADAVLNPLYEAHFAELDMADAAAEAQRRGIVATPVLPPAAVLTNEHLSARGTFTSQEVAPGVTAAMHAGFFELDGRRAGPSGPPPLLGADRDEVLAEVERTAPRAAQVGTAQGLPLADLSVLDFGHGAVGVEVGRFFAEYGADVIKVESRVYPDFIRLQTGGENTPSFTSSSRSKRSLGVNAKKAEGRDLLLELAARCDVVVENNSTGTMDELGLGYSHLTEVNKDIVLVSSQLMGSRGPWADWRGYGPSTLAPSGVLHLWDYPDSSRPTGGGTIFPDQFAGRLGAVAALAAIIGRELHGGGFHIEVAQVEVAAGIVADLLAAESVDAGSVQPQGDRSELGSPWGMFPCAGEEQWVAITCRNDDDWVRLTEVIGRPDLQRDPQLATVTGRREQDSAIRELITHWSVGRESHVAAELCQAAGVPAGAMLIGVQLADDPHLVARGFPVEVVQPDLGPIVLEGPGFQTRSMPRPFIGPAPLLGQHTDEICRDLLSLSESEIARLRANSVLEPAVDLAAVLPPAFAG